MMTEEQEAAEPPAWMREYVEEDIEAATKLQLAARCRQARLLIRGLRAEEAKRPQNTGWAYDTLKNVYVCSATTVPYFEMTGNSLTFPVEQQIAGNIFVPESYEGEKDQHGRFHGQGKVNMINGSTYSGMWEQGLMHGNGTLKWASGVSFKGPFVQGRIKGRGTMKWPGGNVYEGDVLDGHRHGKGKFVMVCESDEVEDESAVITFEGMWANGKRNGVGTLMYDSDGKQRYEGEWLDDLRHGTGIMYYRSGNVYRGGWRFGKHHGHGQMLWYTKNEVYMGEWCEGLQHGKGEHVWFMEVQSGSPFQTQNRYKGDWEKGERHGMGLFEYADGSRYNGQWVRNQKDGEGKYTYPDGKSSTGPFSQDRMVSTGKTEAASAVSEIVLAIDDLLAEAENPQGELSTIKNTLLQYMSELKQIFRYYSQPPREEAVNKMTTMMHAPTGPGPSGLPRGNTPSLVSLIKLTGTQKEAIIDNSFAISMLDFWKFAKECRLPDARLPLAEIDRIFMAVELSDVPTPRGGNAVHVHNPSKKLIFRQFLEGVVRLADYKYHELLPVSRRLCHALYHNILPYACQDLADDVKQCMDSADYKALMLLLDPGLRLHFSHMAKPRDTITLRAFLDMCSRRGYLDAKLTYSQVVNLYYRTVSDDVVYIEANAMNIDVEMIYEEFLEVLLRTGEVRARNGAVSDGGGASSTNRGFVEMAKPLLINFLEYGVQHEQMPDIPPATMPALLPGRTASHRHYPKSASIHVP